MNKWDIIGIIAIGLMLSSASVISYYIIVNEIHSCTSLPLYYTTNQLMNGENWTHVRIEVYNSNEDFSIPIKVDEIDLRERAWRERNFSNLTINTIDYLKNSSVN